MVGKDTYQMIGICPQNLSMRQKELLIVLSELMFGIDILVEWEGIPGESQLSVIANIAS